MLASLLPSQFRSQLKSWGGRLGLLAVSTLVALVLAEVLCRQFVTIGSFRWVADAGWSNWNEADEVQEYHLVAGWRGEVVAPEFRHRVEINSRGFRGPEPEAKPALWVFGDSFVFGVGVEQEESLPGRLAAELKQPVWNFGVPSWSGPQYRRELEKRLAQGRPVAVVVVFYLGERISPANDLIGGLAASRLPLEVPEPQPKPAKEAAKAPFSIEQSKRWLARHSALYSAILSRFGPGLRGLLRRNTSLEPAERKQIEEGWQQLAVELEAFAAITKRECLPFLVVAMPEQGDLAQGGSQIGPRFLALAQDKNLTALDLAPTLKSEDAIKVYYPRDGHLKRYGNQLAARAIAESLGSAKLARPCAQ